MEWRLERHTSAATARTPRRRRRRWAATRVRSGGRARSSTGRGRRSTRPYSRREVLAYDSVGDKPSETYPVHDDARATVWTPRPEHRHRAVAATTSSAAAGTPRRRSVFVAGGNKNAQLEGIVQTHISIRTPTPGAFGRTCPRRWYPSVTPLRNGEMLITEGGPDVPEVRTTDSGLRALTAAALDLPLYPWIDVGPDGRALLGPNQTMRSLDTAGEAPGRASASGHLNRLRQPRVLRRGKILISAKLPRARMPASST